MNAIQRLVKDAIIDLLCDGEIGNLGPNSTAQRTFYDNNLDYEALQAQDEVFTFIDNLAARLVERKLGTTASRKKTAMTFTLDEARAIGDEIGIFWDEVDFTPEDFLAGLQVELEHGSALSPLVNVTNDDPLLTGKIAWAHLMESADYYTLLKEVESRFKDSDQPEVPEFIIHGCRYRPADELFMPQVVTTLNEFIEFAGGVEKLLNAPSATQLYKYLSDELIDFLADPTFDDKRDEVADILWISIEEWVAENYTASTTPP